MVGTIKHVATNLHCRLLILQIHDLLLTPPNMVGDQSCSDKFTYVVDYGHSNILVGAITKLSNTPNSARW